MSEETNCPIPIKKPKILVLGNPRMPDLMDKLMKTETELAVMYERVAEAEHELERERDRKIALESYKSIYMKWGDKIDENDYDESTGMKKARNKMTHLTPKKKKRKKHGR